jgi:hypothetical protein
MRKSKSNTDRFQRQDALGFQIQCSMMVIAIEDLLAQILSQPSGAKDRFEGLLVLCEQHWHSQNTDAVYGCGVELLATLFYIAVNCDDTGIQHRILRLLDSKYRQESQWDSRLTAAIIRWSMCMEREKARRLQILKLSYYHDLTGSGRLKTDLVLPYESPSCVEILYQEYDSIASRECHWLNFNSPDNARPLIENMVHVFDVPEPIMPASAATLVLAYRKGQRNGQLPTPDATPDSDPIDDMEILGDGATQDRNLA